MKFKLNYTLHDGTLHHVIVEGESVAEIRRKAQEHLDRVGGLYPWTVAIA